MHDETIVRAFLLENYENLDLLESALSAAEKEPNSFCLWTELYGRIHTLRNVSRLLGFRNLAAICVEGERLVNQLERGLLTATPDIIAALQRMVFAIHQILTNIENAGREGERSHNDLVGTLARLQGNAHSVAER